MKTFTFPSFFTTQTFRKKIGTLACCIFLSVGGNCVFAQNNLQVNLNSDPHNDPAIWAQLQQTPLDSLLWQRYVHKQWTEIPLKERLQIKLWIQEMWLNKINGKTEELIASTKTENKNEKITKDKIKSEKVENEKIKSEKIEKTAITKIPKVEKIEKIVKKDEPIKEETPSVVIIPKTEKIEVVASTKSLSKSQKMNELLAKPEVKTFMKDLEESFLAESTEMEELKENLYENFFILEAVLADEFEELGADYFFYKQKYPKGNYSESRWMMEKEQELKKLKMEKLEEMKQTFLERQIN